MPNSILHLHAVVFCHAQYAGCFGSEGKVYNGVLVHLCHGQNNSWDGHDIRHCTSMTDSGVGHNGEANLALMGSMPLRKSWWIMFKSIKKQKVKKHCPTQKEKQP